MSLVADLAALAAAQPVLAGMAGALVAGAAAWSLRTLPMAAWRGAKDLLSWPKIGERRRLANEGPNDGREVVVIWPGRHTSMVHCHYVGCDRPMIVHPMNVEAVAHG